MFGVRRQLNISKLSAGILHWLFHIARLMGIVSLRLKSGTAGQLVIEESGPRWRWTSAIFHIGCLITCVYIYVSWILKSNDLLLAFLHFMRVLLNITLFMIILRLQLFQGPEINQVVRKLLQLFQNVRDTCNRNQVGFGGKYELVILLLTLVCFIIEEIFLLGLISENWKAIAFFIFFTDFIISLGIKLLVNISLLWYLSLGLLYCDINDFLRCQLEGLKVHPTKRKLRKFRRSFKRILAIYEELHSLTSLFQKVDDIPLFFGLSQCAISVLALAYTVMIKNQNNLFLLLSKTLNEVLDMFLLTILVHRAKVQFGEIRHLMLEHSNLGESLNWHRMMEMFYFRQNVYEFRVRPLGMFDVSNELFLVFLSSLVSYFIFILQYRLQLK